MAERELSCSVKEAVSIGASKKYVGTGRFGFTLIRKHPLSETEIADEEEHLV